MRLTRHSHCAHSPRTLRAGSLALALALGACGTSELLAPEDALSADPGTVSASVSAVVVSDAELTEILRVTLDDEYRAEAIYLGVMKDFGSVLPFRNIAKAERQHAKNVLALYSARGLAAASNAWTTANVPHFGTLRAACQAGVTAELENIALYDRYLGLALPADVLGALVRNRRASVQAHLPAFRRCS
jgi:hypothetical protein